MRRIFQAFLYSLSGLRAALGGEAAFRQEVFLCAVLVPIAFFLPVTAEQRMLMVASLLWVLCVELLNTAIEATVDRIGTEHHPLSKKAKDCGSAAVALSLAIAGICWVIPWI